MEGLAVTVEGVAVDGQVVFTVTSNVAARWFDDGMCPDVEDSG